MFPFEAWLGEAPAYRLAAGRPLVGLCYAQSLDGSLTDRGGQPLALSGPESARLTHRLRSFHDGILVGIGTVLSDDPQLTVRLVEGRDPQAVILDSSLRIPMHARLLQENRHGPKPWIAATHPVDPSRRRVLEAAGVRVLELPAALRGGVDLAALLTCLAELGLNSLMVEGGAQVISSFLAQSLADFVVITIAPCFVAGLNLQPQPGLALIATGNTLPRLVETGFERQGEDFIVWGRLREPGG